MQQPAGRTEQRCWPKEKLQPLEAGSASSQYHHVNMWDNNDAQSHKDVCGLDGIF